MVTAHMLTDALTLYSNTSLLYSGCWYNVAVCIFVLYMFYSCVRRSIGFSDFETL